MITSNRTFAVPEPVAARVTQETLSVDLSDGRTITLPVSWYPRLANGTADERNHLELGHFGIRWPDLDEDISIEGIICGAKSGEGEQSFKRWLEYRSRGELPPVPTLSMPDDA